MSCCNSLTHFKLHVVDIMTKYAVPINEYIQAHRDRDESDAKKRLKRSASKNISRNLSDHLDLNFFLKKSESNIYFNHKIYIIFEIFEKKKCNLMCHT